MLAKFAELGAFQPSFLAWSHFIRPHFRPKKVSTAHFFTLHLKIDFVWFSFSRKHHAGHAFLERGRRSGAARRSVLANDGSAHGSHDR